MEDIVRISRPPAAELPVPSTPPTSNRTRGIIALVALAGLLCSGASSPAGCQESSIGPTRGQVVGASVGIGAVLAAVVLVSVGVHNSHHTLNGCVLSGPNGLELRTSDSKTYSLDGSAAAIKSGDHVKLHGSKVKKTKDHTGDQVFRVERLTKNYGPCSVSATNPASAGK